VVTDPSCINKIKDDTTDGVVACIGDMKLYIGVCGETCGKGKNHVEDQGVDGRLLIIVKAWTGFIRLRTGTSRLLL